jgi:hypothetical protein
MDLLNGPGVKYGFTTRIVPRAALAGMVPVSGAPRVGDLAVAEVLETGRHKKVEVREGYNMDLFPGDLLVGAFGNRYATDQFEGYVPDEVVAECDLLSIGGVFGEVASMHSSMAAPTRLRLLGLAADRDGAPINQRDYGLPAPAGSGGGEVILVVGSSMNSGKTTTVGTLARALSRTGLRVAAAKVTGTAAGKDGRFYASCGADPVLDFTDVGYPSTYMLGSGELLEIYHTLTGHLRAAHPDYIILEIADGVFQRETRMLLDSEPVRRSVDHVFFAAGDSLAAECGARFLSREGLPLRATAGALTQSELSIREAEAASGVPCLSVERMMGGALMSLLRPRRPGTLNGQPAQNGHAPARVGPGA